MASRPSIRALETGPVFGMVCRERAMIGVGFADMANRKVTGKILVTQQSVLLSWNTVTWDTWLSATEFPARRATECESRFQVLVLSITSTATSGFIGLPSKYFGKS